MSDRTLDEGDLGDDPIAAFSRWYAEAADAGEPEPDAAAVATATPDGVPSVRFVLVKRWDDRGFVFYTNDHSAKGRDLVANPRAALALRWPGLHRQVRIAGAVAHVEDSEADEYFATRPRPAQISAWASEQSAVLPNRDFLEASVADARARFDDQDVPRPPHWNGWRITPATVEFWQGRADRLHDRLRFRREAGRWVHERLAP